MAAGPADVDERYLAINVAGKGLVVLSACSHAGLINVLTDARANFPDTADPCGGRWL